MENNPSEIKSKVKTIKENSPSKGKSLKQISLNKYLLAWTVVIGFYLLTYILMVKPIPSESNQVVFMLFGSISTGFGTILAFFFGSSQGSETKTDMLKDNISKKE